MKKWLITLTVILLSGCYLAGFKYGEASVMKMEYKRNLHNLSQLHDMQFSEPMLLELVKIQTYHAAGFVADTYLSNVLDQGPIQPHLFHGSINVVKDPTSLDGLYENIRGRLATQPD